MIFILIFPEISTQFRTKLYVDSSVENYLAEDQYVKYALNNIYYIIEETLFKVEFDYKVNVILRDDNNICKWKHIDVIITFPDKYYKNINMYWKEISTEVSNFYNSLQTNTEFTNDIIDNIRKFIYVLIHSEE